ncbi:MAG: phosphomannomutase/phosphoglucomutase [Acidimicrobiia bacterium]|nr:phosphomannomutase/phosphoglucomutase [Acidimicrobiia bacterium]
MNDLDAIFKAYDIRGRTDTGELTESVARAVGAAFARFVDAGSIAIGRDCRSSSVALAEAFADGIRSQGADVIDIGEVATDMVYYVSGAYDVPGAMITASHNPSNYNGIKLCRSGARPIGSDSGLEDIKRMTAEGLPPVEVRGSLSSLDADPGYIAHLFSIVDPSDISDLTVAVDGGNGMAGVVLPEIFEQLDAELIGLYIEPDGTFPNHPANPIEPENLVDLVNLVIDHHPDLGVAFDGDADRAFFIDDQGVPLSGSTTTSLIARWFLARTPGATIVHNLITSRAVPETIEAAGGTAIRTRVGHSYIKQVMAETGAVFGGEHSGHYYFEANYRADSGMLAMLVLLQVLSEAGVPLSELRRSVEPYAQSGEVNFTVTDQAGAIERVAAAFGDAEHDLLDGLTVSWDDRWFNVRASNTEPLLRVNIEASDQAAVDALLDEIKAIVGV